MLKGKPRTNKENGAPDHLWAARGHPREFRGGPKSSQGHPGRRPRVLRELPRAVPEAPGRARERSKSSPGAPKSALRALRESQRALREPETALRALLSSGYARNAFAASTLRVVSSALPASGALWLHSFVATFLRQDKRDERR